MGQVSSLVRTDFSSPVRKEHNKLLLDEIFVISRIIKVYVGVISRTRRADKPHLSRVADGRARGTGTELTMATLVKGLSMY